MKEERREEGERKERGRREEGDGKKGKKRDEKEEEKRKTGNRFLLTCFSLHLVLVDVFFNQPLSQREVDVLYHCLIP